MSVLVKGMKMPENCGICGFKDGCEFSIPLDKRPSDCPLVLVPPHGRLIDLDGTALAQYYDEEHEEWSMKTVTVEDILWEVCENMPPIVIPADKDGET